MTAEVSFASGIVRSFLDDGGVHGMWDVVVRVERDGVHTIIKNRDELALSVTALEIASDEYEKSHSGF